MPENSDVCRYAFFNCDSLTDIVILGNISQISEGVFTDCDNLKSVVIPNSITNIWDGAFSGCNVLKNIYYTGSEDDWARVWIGKDNDAILDATITYNYKVPENG